MMDHSKCEHPRTPKDRAKCRRSNGIVSSNAGTATARVLSMDKVDKEEHPVDRDRQCHNCHLRKISTEGHDRVNNMLRWVCDKCIYILDPHQPIIEKVV